MSQTQQPLIFSSEYWIKETLDFLSKKAIENIWKTHKIKKRK